MGMQRNRAWLALVVIIALLASPAAARAQDEKLPVTPGAGRYVPTAAELGPDRVDVWQAGIDPEAELFKEG